MGSPTFGTRYNIQASDFKFELRHSTSSCLLFHTAYFTIFTGCRNRKSLKQL